MDIPAELQTNLESLITAFTAACATPKPSYSVDGQSVSWGEYLKMLQEAIKTTNELIVAFSPFELRSSIL